MRWAREGQAQWSDEKMSPNFRNREKSPQGERKEISKGKTEDQLSIYSKGLALTQKPLTALS